MIRVLLCASALAVLAACAQKQPDVNVTHQSAPPKVQTTSRSEPVFYNGKTYQLNYSYQDASGAFDARVTGMAANQQKDAVGLATSAVGHFACPSARSTLSGTPSYTGGIWSVPAKCA